jgi:hypothetical protein
VIYRQGDFVKFDCVTLKAEEIVKSTGNTILKNADYSQLTNSSNF